MKKYICEIVIVSFLLTFLDMGCKNRACQIDALPTLDSISQITDIQTDTKEPRILDTIGSDSCFIPVAVIPIVDTVLRVRRGYPEYPGDSNYIQPCYIDFINPASKKVLKTIDVIYNNSFLKAGCTLIPNQSEDSFYSVIIPDKGKKSSLRKLLGKDVLAMIPDSVAYPIGYTQYRIDISSNQFAAVGYTIDLDLDNYKGYCGFGTSRLYVFNPKGKQIFSRSIDGMIHGNPCVSVNGRYVTYLYSKLPSWMPPQTMWLDIIRIADGKLIYHEILGENCNKTIIKPDIKYKRIFVLNESNSSDARLLVLDANKDVLYSATNLNGLTYCQWGYKDFICIEDKRETFRKLFFETDFEIIPLKTKK